MIDESYRAAPFVPSTYEDVEAMRAEAAASITPHERSIWDDLHDVILDRLRGEHPNESFIMHWELAGDIAKDIRYHYQLTPKTPDGSD